MLTLRKNSLKYKDENGVMQDSGVLFSSGTTEVDKTLSKSGMAADAKAVGDELDKLSEEILEDITNIADDINNERNERLANEKVLTERMNTFTTLPEASTSGDAELADARIDFNGNTYANVGEHIRNVTGRLSEENADLKETLSELKRGKETITPIEENGYINASGVESSSSTIRRSEYIDIENKMDGVIVTNSESTSYFYGALYDSNKTFIARVDVQNNSSVVKDVIKNYQNTRYIRFVHETDKFPSNISIVCDIGYVTEIYKNKDRIQSVIDGYSVTNLTYENGYLNGSGVDSSSTTWKRTKGFYSITENVDSTIVENNVTSKNYYVALYDSAYSFIDRLYIYGDLPVSNIINDYTNAEYFRITQQIEYHPNDMYLKTNYQYIKDINMLKKRMTEIVSEQFADFSMFENFGVIGDSYASGEIHVGDNTTTRYLSSWGQVLARMTGSECTNYSVGGMTTRSWLSNTERGKAKLENDESKQLYILALGINDYSYLGGDYLGSENDITTKTDTFYGNYAKIVECIKAHSPNAKIVMSTMAHGNASQTKTDFNNAIINIANHYGLPCIVQDEHVYFNSDMYANAMVGSHPTAPSYSAMAKAIKWLIEKNMKDNLPYWIDYIG